MPEFKSKRSFFKYNDCQENAEQQKMSKHHLNQTNVIAFEVFDKNSTMKRAVKNEMTQCDDAATKDEEDDDTDSKTIVLRIDEPCHHFCESILSKPSSGQSYTGFFNLSIVLLNMTFGKLAIENLIKYGILFKFSFPFNFINMPTSMPAFFLFLCLSIFPVIAFLNEKLMSKRIMPSKLGMALQIINLMVLLTFPIYYIQKQDIDIPLQYLIVCIFYVITFLKIWSYVHINYICRNYSRRRRVSLYDPEKKIDIIWPSNINVKNFAYFLVAPTLCYEVSYPRTKRIRFRFTLQKLFETSLCLTLESFIIQQWIVPIIKTSRTPLIDMNIPEIIERVLHLAVPNNISWLLLFYLAFQSVPNVIAEVLRFGDREFYQDWWNATDIEEFWRKWNIPVHKFAKRHIYKPLIKEGFKPKYASVVVFLISAFLHEYVISVPFRMVRCWAFLAMFLQIPLSQIATLFKGDKGNMAMWFSLIIGQPLVAIMYMHDYIVLRRNELKTIGL